MPDARTPAPDLDLRLVRCFTVVAEHRHFGRAAAELHLTASSLSRQISRLEREVGARLLERTPQGTRLTAAGAQFLPLAVQLLRSGAEASARVRAVARTEHVTIGYCMNVIITPAVRELRRLHPEAEVSTLYLEWGQSHSALLDHRADAVVARLPFSTEALRVSVLYDEPRVLLIPADHRLAGKESVGLDDIAEEPLVRADDPAWNSFWRVDPRPDGRPAPDGPLLRTMEDKIEVVASGQAIAIIPACLGVTGLRPDLTTVPLRDVEPAQVVLATRADERNPLVGEFRRCAEKLLKPADAD